MFWIFLTFTYNVKSVSQSGVIALALPLKVINYLLLIGIIRSGGDTHFVLILETVSIWGIGVPLAAIGAFILQWPVYAVVALVLTEEVFKLLIGLVRFLSGKWIHQLT